MYCDLWPYVWLVFKSGFYSRAGYSGARTVYVVINVNIYCIITMSCAKNSYTRYYQQVALAEDAFLKTSLISVGL